MTVQSATLDQIASLYSSDTTGGETENSGQLGQQDFLTLLITQLKNQDPLNPMESVEFTSQLAQFSSLEQLVGMGESLQAIRSSLQVQEGDQTLQYMGKKVTGEGNTLSLQDGAADPATFSLEEDAQVWISIYSDNGGLVRVLSLGPQEKGECEASWDGKDQSGNSVADGDYLFEVQAVAADGTQVSAQTTVTGEVTGVKYENGEPVLLIGTRQILPESILKVSKL